MVNNYVAFEVRYLYTIGINLTARPHESHAKTPPPAPGPTQIQPVRVVLPFLLLEDTVDKHNETIGLITVTCLDPGPSHILLFVLKRGLGEEKGAPSSLCKWFFHVMCLGSARDMY